MADIANNIKSLRQQRQMTQTQLAEKLGVTRQTVSPGKGALLYA